MGFFPTKKKEEQKNQNKNNSFSASLRKSQKCIQGKQYGRLRCKTVMKASEFWTLTKVPVHVHVS
jgi:hypothetical protein